jgi:hypothetical protein
MHKVILTASVPDNRAEDFATYLRYAMSQLKTENKQFGLVVFNIEVEAAPARRLAEVYFTLYPKESPELTLKDNPSMDRVAVWDCATATFQSWLDRLAEKPEKALAMSNWAGKVTKAYFKMLGRDVPPNKKLIVRFVTQGY